MPQDKKISELNVASPLDGTELVPIVQSGETKAVTAQDIADLAGPGGPGSVDSVNGQTGVVVLNANDVGALQSGDNISLLTNDEGYLKAGDNISSLNDDLNLIKENDNISLLNNDEGYLKSGDNVSELVNDVDYASYGPRGWFDKFSQYSPDTDNLNFERHDRGVMMEIVSPQIDILNESYHFKHNVLEFDTTDGDYGDTNQFIVLDDKRFTHRNEGKIGYVVLNNNRVELGYNDPGGKANIITVNDNQLRLEQDYEVEQWLKVNATDIFVDENAKVGSFAVNAEYNITNYGDLSTSGYIGLRLHARGKETSSFGNIAMIDLGLFDENSSGFNELSSAVGIRFNISNTVEASLGMAAFQSFMGDSLTTNKVLLQGNGRLEIFANKTSTNNIFTDQIHLVGANTIVLEDNPLSGTDVFSILNLGGLVFQDDVGAGPLGMGIVANASIINAAGSNDAVVDRVTVFAGATAIEGSSTSGTIKDVSVFYTMGAIDFGMTGAVDVETVKAFHMAPFTPGFSLGDEQWGLYIENDLAENYLEKCLSIGKTKVDNEDIALQIEHKKAIKLKSMSEAERDNLNTEEDMIVLVDDGVNKKLQIFNGANWVDL
jgi:hypothetical protein